MLRRLFTLVAALSLLLCAAAVVLWVRSHHDDGDSYTFVERPNERSISTDAGSLVFRADYSWSEAPPLSEAGNSYDHQWLGFRAVAGWSWNGLTKWWIVPLWFPVVLFALPPLIWILLFVRRRLRRPSGGCPTCGYDLRATPDRCPECGSVPASARAVATRIA